MQHVNQKSVLYLAAVALAALIAATVISIGRKPASEGTAELVALVPGLAEKVNELKSVSLTGAGDKLLVTLEKGDHGWTVKEKGGYAADIGKIREWLLKLADARLLEKKTANAQRYADLGVEDVKEANAKGVRVKLEGLPKAAEFIVGNVNGRADGTFVRPAGEPQSWLAKGNLTPEKDVANWLDKTLTDIPASRIREVSIVRPDGGSLRVFKDQAADANFKLADLPKGRELASPAAADAPATILAALNLEDVVPAKDAEPPADGKVHKARFTAFDGLVAEMVGWKQDSKHQVRLTASLDAARADAEIKARQAQAKADFEAKQKPVEAPKEGEKPAEKPNPPAEPAPLAVSDPAKDRQQKLDALNAEVNGLNQRFSGWTFTIPSLAFDSLDKSKESLLKPLADNKPAAKTPASPAPKH